ncbi:hypothetical protein OG739_26330 [Streptomyces longwoodensis]|uniref:hypothetical protein n=1 Tax=Streptomyces longwoodensis TaxID=68231 RepID=UPI002DD7FD88|nr:hypothetical protein [Streptomyces longwoodensis]WRY90925.1 hypothetical protein OG481_21535 [Streptomyces longwoodensis]WTI44784.1 hypothetical protein OG547_09785 [Streptomyces longwoodensis]
MCRTRTSTRRSRRLLLAATVSAVLVTGVSGCGSEEEAPVPKASQIVGLWKNPGGDWIDFRKDGTGTLSAGVQVQLNSLVKPSETKDVCAFSWGLDTVPAGGGKWVAMTFAEGQCGSLGSSGLNYYYRDSSGELLLANPVEAPRPEEVYARSAATS